MNKEVELNLTAVDLIKKKPAETLYFIYMMMSALTKKSGNKDFTLDDVDEMLIEYLKETRLVLEEEKKYDMEIN